MRKKALLVALALMMTMAFSSVALAFNTFNSMPLWDNLCSCTPDLTIRGNTAYCSFDANAFDSRATITARVTLQKMNSDGVYGYVTGWSGLSAKGVLHFSESYTITESGNYRIKCDINVGDEGVTFYSYATK